MKQTILYIYILPVEGKDEIDYMMPDGQEVSDRVRQLASGLRREITRLITFSNEDLQVYWFLVFSVVLIV